MFPLPYCPTTFKTRFILTALGFPYGMFLLLLQDIYLLFVDGASF
jgi:hypothetical protein